jgi:hypothetical protein
MKRAIFLVGGPGSGKDLIVNTILNHYGFKEYNTDQIKENKQYDDNIVINANAHTFDKIQTIKNIMEDSYYRTSMIFVGVSDETSRERMINKHLSEDLRKERTFYSQKNLDKFKEIFEDFYYFDNNQTIDSNKTITQLAELDSYIEEKLSDPVTNFKKKLLKKKGKNGNGNNNPYNPLLPNKDGILPTFDTKLAGNGDMMSNYSYRTEAMDPAPLIGSGIGMGIAGNSIKVEPMKTYKPDDSAPKKKIFKRAKRILFKKED